MRNAAATRVFVFGRACLTALPPLSGRKGASFSQDTYWSSVSPRRHIASQLEKEGGHRHHIHAVNARQIDTADAREFRFQIQAGLVLLEFPPLALIFLLLLWRPFHGTPGRHNIAVLYFDVNGGEARFQLAVGDQVVRAWTAAEHFPTKTLNGDSATRLTIPNVKLQPNDVITLEGIPDGDDPAALDYVEVK
jgi:hypothetical protein